MLELREFNLQFALSRAGALGEDVENQGGAVEHLAVEDALKVAALCRGKFVVENDRVHVLATAMLREFIRLAAANEGARDGGFHFLGAVSDDFAASSAGEFREFVQGFASVEDAAGFKFHTDEENPFSAFGGSRD